MDDMRISNICYSQIRISFLQNEAGHWDLGRTISVANHSFQTLAVLPIAVDKKCQEITWEKCILLLNLSWKWSEYFISKLFKTVHQAWQILAWKVDVSQGRTIKKNSFIIKKSILPS